MAERRDLPRSNRRNLRQLRGPIQSLSRSAACLHHCDAVLVIFQLVAHLTPTSSFPSPRHCTVLVRSRAGKGRTAQGEEPSSARDAVRRSVPQCLSTQALPPSSAGERERELACRCWCRRSGVATDTKMTEMLLYTAQVCLTRCKPPAAGSPLPVRALTRASKCNARCSAGLCVPPAGRCPR